MARMGDRGSDGGPDRRKLREKLDALPDAPGVYLYRNGRGEVLYVGKAKSLRSRVRSYFRPAARHAPRTERLVSEIADLEIVVVDTEMEAILLEANLIRHERPPYNVVLRDDKSFLYLKLSVKDEYPRATLVRRARVDGSLHVGPFLPAAAARRSLRVVQRHFQVATCGKVFDGKRRPCLYYHLDQCLAPCAGKTSPEEYGRAVREARWFLEGRHRELEKDLQSRMREASAAMEYERAARLRDTLAAVRGLAVRQHIVSVGLEEQDYFAHHREGERVALELFEMRAGNVRSRREFAFENLDFDPAGFYAAVLAQCYAEGPPPREVYVPHLPAGPALLERWLSERRGSAVRIRVPERGVKRRLLEVVRKNAALAFEGRFRAPHGHGVEASEALAEALGLEDPPFRIECFDVSELQGTDAFAAVVVWEGGKPSKSEYRAFAIRGAAGPDDCASIAEAVARRYRRQLAEDRKLPDLVLIDGGAGQLGAAARALAEVGLPALPVISLAKREEEIFVRGGSAPLRLDRGSPALQLAQRIRDEAHRFVLSRHRAKRARRTLRSVLLDVPGIGPATARILLREFGSADRALAADRGEIGRIAGRRAALRIEEWRSRRAPKDRGRGGRG